ncbi:hypothetical protein BaRGS_00011771 [Batillaria attramentaria]|uniref:Uncharacterized protein n=1 Tax=Batillaria attramentaria TaxID=370345 RepID=A0ABD0LCK2_9CAEN
MARRRPYAGGESNGFLFLSRIGCASSNWIRQVIGTDSMTFNAKTESAVRKLPGTVVTLMTGRVVSLSVSAATDGNLYFISFQRNCCLNQELTTVAGY